MRIDSLPPVRHYLSTGCTLLDLAIADRLPGGFPGGRISHVVGTESSSKSILAIEPLGSAQRQGGFGALVDSEGTFDKDRAGRLFGIDINKLLYLTCENELNIEFLFDKHFTKLEDKAAKLKKPSACSIDSLSAIPSIVEVNEDLTDKTYGTSRAKILSQGFRKHIWKLSQTNLALIFIDQVRQNVGVTFGKAYTFSGGEALKFYSSVRVFVKVQKKIEGAKGNIIGVEVSFNVEKNKIAPPFRSGTFFILFDYGIDDTRSNLVFLKNVLKEDKYGISTMKKYQNLKDAIQSIEDSHAEPILAVEVLAEWRRLYAVEPRKERERK